MKIPIEILYIIRYHYSCKRTFDQIMKTEPQRLKHIPKISIPFVSDICGTFKCVDLKTKDSSVFYSLEYYYLSGYYPDSGQIHQGSFMVVVRNSKHCKIWMLNTETMKFRKVYSVPW